MPIPEYYGPPLSYPASITATKLAHASEVRVLAVTVLELRRRIAALVADTTTLGFYTGSATFELLDGDLTASTELVGYTAAGIEAIETALAAINTYLDTGSPAPVESFVTVA
ncbi:MAG: hypothetical protein PHU75_03885 [Candidatus Nanopelagicales bacterium]|nr:hypothetical protein [Candidatus Nanopelagicales bacterium]